MGKINIDYAMLKQRFGDKSYQIGVIPQKYRRCFKNPNPAGLTKDEQAIIQLRIFNKWTVTDISQAVHLSRRTVFRKIKSAETKIIQYT